MVATRLPANQLWKRCRLVIGKHDPANTDVKLLGAPVLRPVAVRGDTTRIWNLVAEHLCERTELVDSYGALQHR